MKNYTLEQLKEIPLDEAKAELANRVYQAAIFFEQLESAGRLHGNGHHLAQHVSTVAADLLNERWGK